jgi:hypothetical protein
LQAQHRPITRISKSSSITGTASIARIDQIAGNAPIVIVAKFAKVFQHSLYEENIWDDAEVNQSLRGIASAKQIGLALARCWNACSNPRKKSALPDVAGDLAAWSLALKGRQAELKSSKEVFAEWTGGGSNPRHQDFQDATRPKKNPLQKRA